MNEWIFWLIVGALAPIPLMVYARNMKTVTMLKLFGRSILVAAVIYVGFGLLWGDQVWRLIELAGIPVY